MKSTSRVARILLLSLGACALARAQPPPQTPPPAANAGLIKILRAAGICPADGECTPTPDKLKLLEAAAKTTEQWEPVPPKVLPGAGDSAPPSDAIILFDGRNIDQWISTNDHSPARWPVQGGVLIVDKSLGNIETKQHFRNYQLHIEWLIPLGINGEGQRRGNSGVFLASTGPGDDGYEIQILDSWDNPTYVNGQTASVYKQAAPLVNASRPPGEWQSYDIVWIAPTFAADGSVQKSAYVTVFHNGVLVQNHVRLHGETVYIGKPFYRPYSGAGIKLQAHSDPSYPPLRFRNIWVRNIDADESGG
jgi:hypothetical protein